MAGNTYKGLAPATDPVYGGGWTIMLEQNNLDPAYVKRVKARLAAELAHERKIERGIEAQKREAAKAPKAR